MPADFTQIEWNAALAQRCRHLIQLAQQEDLQPPDGCDLTTTSLVPRDRPGKAAIVAREEIIAAGLLVVVEVARLYSADLTVELSSSDGDTVYAGQTLATISGPAADLLTAERVMLNFLGRLCGIATQTRRYVDAVAGTGAHIYDTRKTTPAWRELEKYAVRCGGGRNHRTGLYDAILIKDNHLAFGDSGEEGSGYTPASSVRRAREFLAARNSAAIVEIEVDTLEQLQIVLPENPDIVLLDNMPPEVLREAVEMRKRLAPNVQLEASGGITMENIRAIGLSGVERVSIGALTHASRWVDVGLDWLN